MIGELGIILKLKIFQKYSIGLKKNDNVIISNFEPRFEQIRIIETCNVTLLGRRYVVLCKKGRLE